MGKRTTQLGEITTVDNNDILYGVDVDDLTHSPDGTSVKFKKSNLLKEVVQGISDNAGDISDIQTDVGEINDQITDIYSAIEQGYTGWNPITAGCTYQGADAPSYSMYIEGNANLFLTLGMRILLTNGGSAKMFILTLIGSYDAGNDRTLLTMYGGTDYTLANSAITNVYFSPHKAPYGFPLSPAKWTQVVTSSTNYTGTGTTNWQYAGSSIAVPIGVWKAKYKFTAQMTGNGNSVCIVWGSLSTANNSSIADFTSYQTGSNQSSFGINAYGEGLISVTSKTTYYATCRFMHGISNVGMSLLNADSPLVISLECAYL